MTTGTLALIIFSVILAQVAIVMLLILYRRKHEYQELDASKDTSPAVSAPSPSLSRHAAETIASGFTWEGYSAPNESDVEGIDYQHKDDDDD